MGIEEAIDYAIENVPGHHKSTFLLIKSYIIEEKKLEDLELL